VSETSGRRTSGRQPQQAPKPAGRRQPPGGPAGPSRSGRREADRTRPVRPASPFERYRTPILAIVVVALVTGVGLFVFQSAAAPVYACSSIDTVQPAASGELGQVQPDQGNQHVATGDKITYAVCPPASGHHVNQPPNGPVPVKVYGPNDVVVPNGWIHNLEHGGLVLLYSCAKGACDDALTTQLDAFSAGFPASPVCGIPAGTDGPVVAPFDQMPTRFAALVWDHALYLDTLDTQKIDDFFLRYGEKVANDGTWIAPPEPQCTAPKPSPSASAAVASPAPSASGG
jgi:Protein of unknown function (DUF3105)